MLTRIQMTTDSWDSLSRRRAWTRTDPGTYTATVRLTDVSPSRGFFSPFGTRRARSAVPNPLNPGRGTRSGGGPSHFGDGAAPDGGATPFVRKPLSFISLGIPAAAGEGSVRWLPCASRSWNPGTC